MRRFKSLHAQPRGPATRALNARQNQPRQARPRNPNPGSPGPGSPPYARAERAAALARLRSSRAAWRSSAASAAEKRQPQ